MSGRSYPIWCDVWAPDYANSNGKGYGARAMSDTTVRVGSSPSYSEELVRTTVHKLHDGEFFRFEFLVDLLDGEGSRVVKCKWFNPDTKEFYDNDPRGLVINRELPDMYELPEAE